MKFLLGLTLGLMASLLFAPAPGEETRRALRQKFEELKGIPEEKIAQAAEEAKRKAGELGADVGRRAAESAVEAAERGILGQDQTAS